MANLLKTKSNMIKAYTCKYCEKSFTQEKTLVKHICVKKRRYMEIDSQGSRFGLRAFQRFYSIASTDKVVKTAHDFISSPYYIDFIKFGNHLAVLKPVYVDQFIDFVINNSIKLKDWTSDFVYDIYIEDLVKKEPVTSAMERSIIEIMDWAAANNTEFSNFFVEITANEASYMIRTGKISPWLLYLANTGEHLMNEFTADHSKIIGKIIDPAFWMKKFKKNSDDVEYVRNLLEQINL